MVQFRLLGGIVDFRNSFLKIYEEQTSIFLSLVVPLRSHGRCPVAALRSGGASSLGGLHPGLAEPERQCGSAFE
jgi:hypothetical protein